jgi:hypothetical protein
MAARGRTKMPSFDGKGRSIVRSRLRKDRPMERPYRRGVERICIPNYSRARGRPEDAEIPGDYAFFII